MKTLNIIASSLLLSLLLYSCNKNENAPTIVDQEFTIQENSPSGTLIGAVEATDPDEGQLSNQDRQVLPGTSIGASPLKRDHTPEASPPDNTPALDVHTWPRYQHIHTDLSSVETGPQNNVNADQKASIPPSMLFQSVALKNETSGCFWLLHEDHHHWSCPRWPAYARPTSDVHANDRSTLRQGGFREAPDEVPAGLPGSWPLPGIHSTHDDTGHSAGELKTSGEHKEKQVIERYFQIYLTS